MRTAKITPIEGIQRVVSVPSIACFPSERRRMDFASWKSPKLRSATLSASDPNPYARTNATEEAKS
jgi:hypothetical protein